MMDKTNKIHNTAFSAQHVDNGRSTLLIDRLFGKAVIIVATKTGYMRFTVRKDERERCVTMMFNTITEQLNHNENGFLIDITTSPGTSFCHEFLFKSPSLSRTV